MSKSEEAKKFRKKPVVVEAMQFSETKENLAGILKFCPQAGILPSCLLIKTLEGTHRANYGDWIVKGIQGEFYPCKPDIFEQTYEPFDE